MTDRPPVFQVHATLRGELVSMCQRAYPQVGDGRDLRDIMIEARDAAVADANTKGGYDNLVFHTEESPGFLWMATGDRIGGAVESDTDDTDRDGA